MFIYQNHSVCDFLNNVDLKLIAFGHAAVENSWRGTVQNADFSRLYFILRGSFFLHTTNGRTICLKEGHCYLIPSGAQFTYGCEKYTEHVFFHLKLCKDGGMDLLRTEETYVAEQMDTDQDGARFVEMIQHCNQTEGLLIKRLLYRWVEHFAALHPVLLQIPQYSWCVVKAMTYINMHRSVAITVEEISAYVNVSKSTLTKHFRQELNRTVVEYIYEVVMAEACRLLCGTRKTVAEISNQLGFCDAFYFSRRFSERYGIPPRDYSKQPLL